MNAALRGRPTGVAWIAASSAAIPMALAVALLATVSGSSRAPEALVVFALALLAVRLPAWIVPGFIALTWMSLPQSVYGGLPSPVETGGLILLGLAAYRVWRTPAPQAPLTVLLLIALAMTATGLLAVSGTEIPFKALGSLSFLAIVAFNLRDEDAVERTIIGLCVAGLVLGLGASYSVLVHPTAVFPLNDEVTGAQAARAAGPFGESNFFALSMAALVPFALYLMSRHGIRRLLGTASVISLIAGVLSTGSRGALIAIAVGLLAFALFSGDRRARLLVIVAVAAGLAITPLFSAQTSSSAERTVSGRLTENRVSIAMFEDHPVAGVGPSGYPPLYRDYARVIGNDPRVLREPHSLPLQIAAEQGVVGLLSWICAGVIVVGFARAARLWRSRLGRATILSLVTYLTGSLFLHGSQLNLLFVLLGLLFALGAARLSSDPSTDGRARRSLQPAGAR